MYTENCKGMAGRLLDAIREAVRDAGTEADIERVMASAMDDALLRDTKDEDWGRRGSPLFRLHPGRRFSEPFALPAGVTGSDLVVWLETDGLVEILLRSGGTWQPVIRPELPFGAGFRERAVARAAGYLDVPAGTLLDRRTLVTNAAADALPAGLRSGAAVQLREAERHLSADALHLDLRWNALRVHVPQERGCLRRRFSSHGLKAHLHVGKIAAFPENVVRTVLLTGTEMMDKAGRLTPDILEPPLRDLCAEIRHILDGIAAPVRLWGWFNADPLRRIAGDVFGGDWMGAEAFSPWAEIVRRASVGGEHHV